jgi:hypothetical protein
MACKLDSSTHVFAPSSASSIRIPFELLEQCEQSLIRSRALYDHLRLSIDCQQFGATRALEPLQVCLGIGLKSVSDPMSSDLIIVVVSVDLSTIDSTVNQLRIDSLAKPTRPACLWLFNFGKNEKSLHFSKLL